jgi:hypothetical protein
VDTHHDQDYGHQNADCKHGTANQELPLNGRRSPRAAAPSCPLSRGSTKTRFFYFIEERHE